MVISSEVPLRLVMLPSSLVESTDTPSAG